MRKNFNGSMIEKKFINQGIKKLEISEFLVENFGKAAYDKYDIKETPIGTMITLYTDKPGMIIGKSGNVIKQITNKITEKFSINSLQLEVKQVENPNKSPEAISKRISSTFGTKINYKKVIGYILRQSKRSGIKGIEIIVSGKVRGNRSRVEKFKEGHLKYSGTKDDVIFANSVVNTRAGTVGVKVTILLEKNEIKE